MENQRFVDDEERWQAVASRDVDALGQFFYGVSTTRVFCRPSCASRRPLRKNVQFFDSTDEAVVSGYRPCKRCRPQDDALNSVQINAVVKACRAIEESAVVLTADELAETAAMSKFHFQRVFKMITGLTVREYGLSLQAERVHEGLRSDAAVADVLYDAGFSSSGRFYEAAPSMLGMKPKDVRARGKGQTIRFAVGACSLGSILVAATQTGLCAILLGDDPELLIEDLQRRFAGAELIGADGEFESWVAQVVGFVETPRLGLDLPLDIQGTAFQRRVWQALAAIPVGSTASYIEIARAVGAPTASRAIAQACGANPLAVAIPCHRVVRSDGALSGYRWGIERKRELLRREEEPAENP
jgi:AraC family transcriptional regulator of adaptative response/methylated-DNA-[protein]-cysteine methyltransferase